MVKKTTPTASGVGTRYNYVLASDPGFQELALEGLLSQMTCETVGIRRSAYLSTGVIGALNGIGKAMCEGSGLSHTIRALDGNQYVLSATDDDGGVQAAAIVETYGTGSVGHPTKPTTAKYNLTIVVPRTRVLVVEHALEAALRRSRVAVVTWWFQKKGDHGEKVLTLPEPPPIHDAFYPYIDTGVEAFVKQYMQSSECILFLYGQPGTGKTSFLRWLMWYSGLHCYLTYDEQLLSSDEMFVDFIDDDTADLMIVEDADTMLTKRSVGGNKAVARFLNASDGIIKFPRKKLVFTTNLVDLEQVDSALRRAGRCFGEINCRALTYDEACVAAKVAGLAMPKKRGAVTLADLFNPHRENREPLRMGFAQNGR